jgi:hypothetical protein
MKGHPFRRIILAGAVLLLIGAGFLLLYNTYLQRENTRVKEEATVLLERIERVSKLITVEGYFSEIYDYKNYWQYDWGPFTKKALLRVKAKVSVGYDLSRLKVEALPEKKIIRISQLPDPQILSIDHDLDYYDITEGIFNSFSEADYNTINRNAKKMIESQAAQSDLMLMAEQQAGEALDLLRILVESAGWSLQFSPNEVKETEKNS